ncbi:prokineticin-2 isoform X2 [Alexandromys fortis]|uniref:prokineticin-2 isoform X2 n=1 Tax=Alexandromys fortis TaxID=100897 RepID=UPI00215397ED|nr:prokineticin-2 isoform X2 [Microtus fortis]
MDVKWRFPGGSAGSHQPEQNVSGVTDSLGTVWIPPPALRWKSAPFSFFNRTARHRNAFSSPRALAHGAGRKQNERRKAPGMDSMVHRHVSPNRDPEATEAVIQTDPQSYEPRQTFLHHRWIVSDICCGSASRTCPAVTIVTAVYRKIRSFENCVWHGCLCPCLLFAVLARKTPSIMTPQSSTGHFRIIGLATKTRSVEEACAALSVSGLRA